MMLYDSVILLYTKSNCKYCTMSKNLISSHELDYDEVKITEETIDQIKSMFPDAKTVPIITVDGRYIGGYTELKELINESNII